MTKIKVIYGDITKLKVEAIVNAANKTLLGGGGVDGAIHRAAGPKLLEECSHLNGCPTGDAKITRAYNLMAKYIIHTVGPIWYGGKNHEIKLLASCYMRSLKLAIEHQIKSIAFPNISTGVYRFPKEEAAHIAIDTVKKYTKENKNPEEVIFCTFDQENFAIYKKILL